MWWILGLVWAGSPGLGVEETPAGTPTEVQKTAASASNDMWVVVRAAGGQELERRLVEGLQFQENGRYAEAERVFRDVVGVLEQRTGVANLVTLALRSNIARMLYFQGRAAEAEREYQTVLALQILTRGRDHPDTLGVMNDLAAVHRGQGRITEVEQEYRALLEAEERVLPPEHPFTLATHNNLALALSDQGRFAEAEREYLALLKIWEHTLRPEDDRLLSVRNNLAIAYRAQGRLSEAEQEYQAVLAVRERTWGPEHPDTLSIRNNLANVCQDQDRLAEAESTLRAVLAIQTRTLGPEAPDTLDTGNNLANVYQHQRRLAEAETAYRTVLAIRERVLGLEHPRTLGTRANLASVLADQGRSADAERETLAVLAIWESTFGSEHPGTLGIRSNVAMLYAETNRPALALPLAEEALRGQLRHLQTFLPSLPQGQAREARKNSDDSFDLYLAVQPDDRAAWTRALAWKGIVGRLRDARFAAIRASNDPKVELALTRWRDAVYQLRQLQDQAQAGDGYVARLQEAESRVQQAEATFATLGFPLPEPPTPDEVCASLPDGATLLDGVQLPASYVVFVVQHRSPSTCTVRRVNLPSSSENLASLVDSYLWEIPRMGSAPSAGNRLRETVWDPLWKDEPAPRPNSTVWISPDGPLALLPFASLPTPSGFLVDDYTIVTQDTLEKREGGKRNSGGLIVGMVNYPDARWDPLPGTATELGLIPGARILQGKEATMAALREALPGHRLLHLATHGFAEGTGSFLVFADGLLESGEVEGLDLKGTEQVVLSACETGRGVVGRGEGLTGLRRSFLRAGVERVLSTAWKIPDERTGAFWEHYYTQEGNHWEALRETQRWAKDHEHWPVRDWGAFLVGGEP